METFAEKYAYECIHGYPVLRKLYTMSDEDIVAFISKVHEDAKFERKCEIHRTVKAMAIYEIVVLLGYGEKYTISMTGITYQERERSTPISIVKFDEFFNVNAIVYDEYDVLSPESFIEDMKKHEELTPFLK
jgi:hypothetical protein